MDTRNLKTARLDAERTQAALAELVGASPSNVSAYETGGQSLGLKMATKLADDLGADPLVLVAHNQKAVMDRAMRNGDTVGAIKAATRIVEVAERIPRAPDDEEALDEIVRRVVAFAEKAGDSGYRDTATYGDTGERDILGRVAAKGAAHTEDVDPAFYNLAANHQDDLLDRTDEGGYSNVEDGRDIFGHRVAPLTSREED